MKNKNLPLHAQSANCEIPLTPFRKGGIKIPLTHSRCKTGMFHFKKGGVIAFLLVISLLAPQKIFAETLFFDNFNVSSSGDLNNEYNSPGRQRGTFAPLEYNDSSFSISDTGTYADKCYNDQDFIFAAPQRNFIGQGNFAIEFDLDLYTNLTTHFMAMNFGKPKEELRSGMPGISLMFGKFGGSSVYAVDETNDVMQNIYPYPGLFTDSNMAHNIKISVSQTGFPPTSNEFTLVALFIDDIPYPLGLGGGKHTYVRTLVTNLANNYIAVGSYGNGAYGEPFTPMSIDNFGISTLVSNKIFTTAWTSDADSGIDSSKIYTHAVNFGDSANLSINGVPFTGSGSAMSGSDWKLSTADFAPLSGPTTSSVVNISGAGSGLVSNFLESAVAANAGGLIISGLTPYMQYELSLFCVGSEAAGGRQSYFATSGGAPIIPIDQDEFGAGNGQRLTCSYTASKDGTFTISTTPLTVSIPRWNWYGFCNKALPPTAPSSISATKGVYTDKIYVNWEEILSAQSYFVYRAETNDLSTTNFVVQVISNFFDDTVPSVIVAKDYYYWVQSANMAGVSDIFGSDYGFTKSIPPDTPIAISPDGIVVTSPVEFTASAFNDGSGFSFAASHWQVSSDSGFSSIKWETGENGPPVFSIFASRISIPDGTNFWRVRYKNDRNTWSEWADSNLFVCVQGAAKPGIFKDSFNVIGTGNINLYCNADGRQSGNATPLNYIVSGTTELGSGAANPGELLLGQNSGCSPLMSFESSDKFNIEFDVKLHNFDGSADWLSLSLGNENQSSILPDDTTGLGALFLADGTFQFYAGTTLLHTQANAIPAAQEFHVFITTSTDEFGEGDPAYCSVFVNGTPIQNSVNVNNKYAYTLANGFAKNYVNIYNNNYIGTSPSLIDNFVISYAPTNVVTVHPWTGDADSLIDETKEYTHLVNIDGEDVTINTHTFIGTGILTNQGFNNGDPNITTSTWALIDASNYMNFWPDTVSPNLPGSSLELGRFGAIGAGSPALVLSGLTPNSSNTLYLYSWARETGSEITFPSSYGGAVDSIDVDQYGQGNGIIIQYDYIADANGKFTVAAVPEIDNLRFFICGFANRETGSQNPEIDVDNMLAFGEDIENPKSLPMEIANIGGGIVSGIITGIEEPFSLSTNIYYAVPGTNDIISVTFTPTAEGVYTNVITLSGNGGAAEITLIGSGIPEPCLFIIVLIPLFLKGVRGI